VIAAGIEVPRPVLHRRIETRAARIMPALVAETQRLLELGHRAFIETSQIIGYAEAVAFLEGRIGEEEARGATVKRTKALARRQMAWFRRDPRIRWFQAGEQGGGAIAPELIAFFQERLSSRPSGATMTVEA
jgi:tRNA dimethylallyltransferase